MEFEVGMIFSQETCDEIHFDLSGNFEEINPHVENWVIENITANNVKLWNLTTQRARTMTKEDLKLHLKGGIFKLTTDRG